MAINSKLGNGIARALDGRTVQVKAPTDPNARVNFIAELEELVAQMATIVERMEKSVEQFAI